MGGSVVLVTIIYLTGVHCGLFNTGPYDLKLIRYEICKDQGTSEGGQNLYLVKKSTRKTFLSGNLTLPFDFDETIKSEIKFSRLGSRGWGVNAYNMKYGNMCASFRKDFPTIFDFYFKSWGIEKPSCPIKAGNYTVEMDTDLPRLSKLPMLPYGTYKMSHSVLRGDPPVRLGCEEFYVTCTERPR